MVELQITSTIDGSKEPVLFDFPQGKTNVPLFVGLHTWSFDRFNQVDAMLPLCQERDWALLLPEFRGANLSNNPRAQQACASALAIQDVIDAVDTIAQNYAIDPTQIFLMGGSGGGHMALMMAGHAPNKWRAISAWVPVTDLATWYGENEKYAPHIVACCGGKPGESTDIDRAYQERSPMSFLDTIAQANLYVHHGRHDPSVPYTHTYKLAQEIEKRNPKSFYFEIFDGGHQLRYHVAFKWFESQLKTENQKTLTG